MKYILLSLFLCLPFTVSADDFTPAVDSILPVDSTSFDYRLERLFRSRAVQSTYIGVPLIAAGFIEMSENDHFRTLRNDFLPQFRNHTDDYIQYSPAAVMLALKACGVPSASSWKKMLTADAFSVALVTLMTRSIKPLAKEERPDGSNRHSFPSGHTATAFMTATMLSKEYGYLSPWVSFGAYTVATATGVMRMMNNRHWMSDVLAGAGFGIIGTELGYWLADITFPNHPKSYDPSMVTLIDADKNPSFIGTFAGFHVPTKRYRIGENLEKKSSNGGTIGLEGAYFFSRHFGIGGQISISYINYIIDGKKWVEDTSHFYSLKAGGYYSCTVYQRLFLMAKLLGGYTIYPDINEKVSNNAKKSGLVGLVGLDFGIRARQHLDFKIGMDYETLPSPFPGMSNLRSMVFKGSANIRF
jgi:membrane-associated phospholipid phosphatase